MGGEAGGLLEREECLQGAQCPAQGLARVGQGGACWMNERACRLEPQLYQWLRRERVWVLAGVNDRPGRAGREVKP